MHRRDIQQKSQYELNPMSRLYEIHRCVNADPGILSTDILIKNRYNYWSVA